jgi:hypothetical protein
MEATKNSLRKAGGIGFSGLLTVAFVVLKLTNVIDWNWFWVLSPLIIPTGMIMLLIGILHVFGPKHLN